MFNPSRLSVARQRAGLTKKELANAIDVEPRAITGFEAGQYMPTDDNVAKLSNVLNFPQEYFFKDDLEMLSVNSVSFRSMSKMTAKQRDAAVAAGSIAYVLSDYVDKYFSLPSPDIPNYEGASPESAALSLRQHWGLGELPIKNMIHLLESRGVRVFSLAENCVEVDAYSVWRGVRPFVFLNNKKSGERRRFDAAHELAHLVLHRHGAPVGIEAEKEAHAFAATFLMPTESVRALGRISADISNIIKLKKKWAVSAVAMTTRLKDVGLLTYHYYNQLFIELSRKGFRTNEPDPIKAETSQVWQKVFNQFRLEGIGVDKLSAELALPEREIINLVFGLTTIGLPTNTILGGGRRVSPDLRLVK